MIEAIHKGVHWLLTFTRTVSAICLIASVIINFTNIIGRYFFNVSIPWAEEIMLFLMVGCVFTGCCAVAWEGRQIRMDVLISMMPPKIKDLLTNKLDKTCYLKADARAKFDKVVDVVNNMRAGGVDQLGLLTEQVTQGQLPPGAPGSTPEPAKP